jgi:hypothetical protein
MTGNLLRGSWILFGLSILFWVALTLFEAALVTTSLSAERVITFLLLVLPAALGALLGIMSLLRKEGQIGFAITATVLNTLFAFFNLTIILFAG